MIHPCARRPMLLMLFAVPAFLLSGGGAAQDPAGNKSGPQEAAESQTDDSSSEQAGPPSQRRAVVPIPMEELAAPLEVQRKAEARIRRALQTKVTAEFQETALREVLFELAERGGFPVVLDQFALQEEGITGDEPVTISLKDVTIRQALERILRLFDVATVYEDEVIKITTVLAAEEKLRTRVYHVRKLLKAMCEAEERARAAFRGNRGQAFAQFGQFGPVDIRGVAEARLIDVVRMLTSGPWEGLGAIGGSVDVMGNLLVVRQVQKVHEEVRALLQAFEAFLNGKLNRGAVTVGLPQYDFLTDRNVRRALKRKIEVFYDNAPLKDVLADLEKDAGIEIVVDRTAFEEDRITQSEPVTLQVKGLTVHSVLRLVCEAVGGITFFVDRGAVTMTTQIQAEEILLTVLYDVGDLVETDEAGFDLIEMLQEATTGPWEHFDGVGGWVEMPMPGLLGVRQTHQVHGEIALLIRDLRREAATSTAVDSQAEPGNQTIDPNKVVVRFYRAEHPDRAEDLAKAVTEFVEPGTWEGKGGEGAVRVVDDMLAVRQTVKVHRQIDEFLRNLQNAERGDISNGAGFSSDPRSRNIECLSRLRCRETG